MWRRVLTEFAVPARQSTPELIAQELRRAIFVGSLTSGTPLKQNDVARQFGVSAAPVREAFQQLGAEGLAVLHRNCGVIIAPLDEADITDIAELRVLLETQAVRKSGPRLTEADLAQAEEKVRDAALPARIAACGPAYIGSSITSSTQRRRVPDFSNTSKRSS